jgi:hypothetical protein
VYNNTEQGQTAATSSVAKEALDPSNAWGILVGCGDLLLFAVDWGGQREWLQRSTFDRLNAK